MKKKKIIPIIISAILLVSITSIFFLTPKTVLKYESDDNKVVVYITQPRNFNLAPMRNQDYTLIVKRKDGEIKKTLLKEEFNFYADSSGIDGCFVDVVWHSDSVTITIDSKDMNEKIFEASW